MTSRLPFVAVAGLLLVSMLGACVSHAPTVGRPGATLRDCRECPELVVVPAGTVMVGGNRAEQEREHVPPDLALRELPAHPVTIGHALAVGRFEVTQGEYSAFVAATHRVESRGCSVLNVVANTWGENADRWRLDPGFAQTERHPVVCVSLRDALDYVEWLASRSGHRYRLPSEGEWEYAARAGSTSTRFWGDDRAEACASANVADLSLADALGVKVPNPDAHFLCRDGFAFTAPVGSFRPNGFGLYDVNGNVWEWTADCHNETLAAAPGDGSARSDGDCAGHMDRGGSWVNSPKYLRTAARHKDVVGMRNTVLGFRVVRDLQ